MDLDCNSSWVKLVPVSLSFEAMLHEDKPDTVLNVASNGLLLIISGVTWKPSSVHILVALPGHPLTSMSARLMMQRIQLIFPGILESILWASEGT